MNNLITTNKTMSSREIAELCNSTHDNVLKTIKRLIDGGIVSKTTPNLYIHPQNKQQYTEYLSDKRDSLVIVARLSPEFTANVVDRWQELENNQPNVKELSRKDLALMVIAEAERAEKAENKVKMLTHQNKLYTATEIAKECGFKSAQYLNEMLHNKKIQYKVNNTWVLCARYAESGFVSIKQHEVDNGKIIYDRKWTGLGRDFILDLFSKKELI